jgi:hypothetical protein
MQDVCQGQGYPSAVSTSPGEVQYRVPVPPWWDVLQADEEASKEHQRHGIWQEQGRRHLSVVVAL